MKRSFLILISILACAGAVFSQVTTQNARRTPTGSGAPGSGGSAPPVACTSGPPFGTDYTDTATTPPTIYKCKSGSLVVTAGGVAEAPADASYITQTPNATLTNEQALSLLATGIPLITTGTGVISISNVTNDVQTKASIVPNTAPSAGQIPVGNAGGTAYAPVSLSQDCTVTSLGVVTCLKTNNVSFGALATVTPGTGVGTAATVNVGSAGAFVVNGGAGGSPSSFGTMPAFTLGGTVSGGGNQINNVIIGTTTPLAGFHTTLSATSSLVTPIIGPIADGTTSIKFTKADLSTVVGVWDTTNTRLRIGSGVAPTVALDVTGAVIVSSTITAGSSVIDGATVANTVDVRNGTNGQIFQIYNTTDGGSNYARLKIDTTSGSGNATAIYTQKAGTGTAQSLRFGTGGNVQWGIDTSGNFIAVTDNTNDIGASGATRPRDFFLGRNATVGGTLSVTGASTLGAGTSSLTSVGTLTGGATGAGFTVALSTSTITGTLADARLSANVPLLNASNTFTGATQIVSAVTPVIEALDTTAGGTGAFMADTGASALWSVNRNSISGTSTDTAKASAMVQLLATAGTSTFNVYTGTTNNSVEAITFQVKDTGVVTLNTANYASCTALTTNASAVVGCTASDLTLKDLKRPFTRGLDAIMGLTPQTYIFKPTWFQYDNGREYSSLVAQNVQQFIPEAVSRMSGGLQVDNATVIGTLVNADKDIKAILVQQQAEILMLRDAVKRLSERKEVEVLKARQ